MDWLKDDEIERMSKTEILGEFSKRLKVLVARYESEEKELGELKTEYGELKTEYGELRKDFEDLERKYDSLIERLKSKIAEEERRKSGNK